MRQQFKHEMHAIAKRVSCNIDNNIMRWIKAEKYLCANTATEQNCYYALTSFASLCTSSWISSRHIYELKTTKTKRITYKQNRHHHHQQQQHDRMEIDLRSLSTKKNMKNEVMRIILLNITFTFLYRRTFLFSIYAVFFRFCSGVFWLHRCLGLTIAHYFLCVCLLVFLFSSVLFPVFLTLFAARRCGWSLAIFMLRSSFSRIEFPHWNYG